MRRGRGGGKGPLRHHQEGGEEEEEEEGTRNNAPGGEGSIVLLSLLLLVSSFSPRAEGPSFSPHPFLSPNPFFKGLHPRLSVSRGPLGAPDRPGAHVQISTRFSPPHTSPLAFVFLVARLLSPKASSAFFCTTTCLRGSKQMGREKRLRQTPES